MRPVEQSLRAPGEPEDGARVPILARRSNGQILIGAGQPVEVADAERRAESVVGLERSAAPRLPEVVPVGKPARSAGIDEDVAHVGVGCVGVGQRRADREVVIAVVVEVPGRDRLPEEGAVFKGIAVALQQGLRARSLDAELGAVAHDHHAGMVVPAGILERRSGREVVIPVAVEVTDRDRGAEGISGLGGSTALFPLPDDCEIRGGRSGRPGEQAGQDEAAGEYESQCVRPSRERVPALGCGAIP